MASKLFGIVIDAVIFFLFSVSVQVNKYILPKTKCPKHLLLGSYKSIRQPQRFASHPYWKPAAACLPGEHTVKVLNELGVPKAKQQSLLKSGTVVSTVTLLQMKKQAKKAKVFRFLDFLRGLGGSGSFSSPRVPGALQKKNPNLKAKGGPMSGVRVAELANMIAGPLAGTILADQGAIVTKYERQGAPDPSRKVRCVLVIVKPQYALERVPARESDRLVLLEPVSVQCLQQSTATKHW